KSKNAGGVSYVLEEGVGFNTYLTKLKPFTNIQVKNNDELFIYNNFPERVMSNVFFETYINKTKRVEGNTRLFVSHGNDTKQNIDYIIRLENKSGSDVAAGYIEDTLVTLKSPSNGIKSHSVDFFNKVQKNNYKQIEIPAYGSYDFIIYNISDAHFFSAQYDFKISGAVDITSFIVPSGNDSRGLETPNKPYTFDYEPVSYTVGKDGMNEKGKYYTTYSGYSRGYILDAENSFKISEADFRNRKNAIGFETGGAEKNLNHRNGVTELLDIFLFSVVGADKEIDTATFVNNIPYSGDEGKNNINRPRNYCNLGNWGIEYNITTAIENDTGADKTLSLNLAAYQAAVMLVEVDGKTFGVNHNNSNLSYAFKREGCQGYDIMDNHQEAATWEILNIFIPAGETREVTYKYILGTDSMSNVFHIWQEK
ncbi:MAG: hypothetical protein LBV08_08115, partial [Clostridiales bacterium]|nr:hypothetical protein [Clostridiales bacterium]